jgi:murein L,D-transpeptidase YafK
MLCPLTAAMAAALFGAAPAEPFAPEACSEANAAACKTARDFVERQKGAQCLVAFKAARLLYLYEQGKPVERSVDLKDYDPKVKVRVPATIRFPVKMALSSHAVGHKLRLNDAHTPEGEYRICDSISWSEYTHFLSISFPAPRDVEAAVKEQRFPEDALARVRRSQHPGACPDFYSALGGAIGIHGAPTGMAADLAAAESKDPTLTNVTTNDWTLGCLAVENRNIRFLAKEVKIGAPILILP